MSTKPKDQKLETSIEPANNSEVSAPSPRLAVRICLNCGKTNPTTDSECLGCQLPFAGQEGLWTMPAEADYQLPAIDDQDLSELRFLRNKYRLLTFLGQSAGIKSFLVRIEEDEKAKLTQRTWGILRTNWEPVKLESAEDPEDDSIFSDPPDESEPDPSDTLSFHKMMESPAERLDREKEVLGSCKSPSLPKLLDCFEERGLRFLVESATFGRPILEAWGDAQVPSTQKFEWLRQLHETFRELHEQDILFPTLEPSRILVDEAGALSIVDVTGLLPLEASITARTSGYTLYTAPELLIPGQEIDVRSDAFTFGAIVCALKLGRNLTNEDFELRGVPLPLTDLFPDELPPFLRLLGKTFAGDPNLRFPVPAEKSEDPSGFAAIAKALANYETVSGGVTYEIAGWSSVGMVRGNNEDAFTIAFQSGAAREYRRNIALVCLADGMGGHAYGEVASGLAISKVADFLRKHGLSSAQLHMLDKIHPLEESQKCAQILEQAVRAANREVFDAAMTGEDRSQMGCTLEAMLLVGAKVFLCHVGDSRVYHRKGSSLVRLTQDQTVVEQLVEMGQLTPEEATVHPRRSELYQALGVQLEIEVSSQELHVTGTDWLLACSDGLTNHVSDEEINQILGEVESADLAARRLVNLVNTRGGNDNCTVVALRVR